MNHSAVRGVDHLQGNGQARLEADPPCRTLPSLADALADPRNAFARPDEVVAHPLLSREEKRTILISWARDELTLEHLANGILPELRPKSQIDPVVVALDQVDPQAASEYRAAVAALRTHKVFARS